jgi:uncharacterized protein with PQ loop repeat
MAKVFNEIQSKIAVPRQTNYLILLFLPSVNFWTSSIGKDGPIFFAISLCIWAALSLRKRFILYGLSVFVMLLFRPHIALLAALALGGAAFLGSTVTMGRKIGILTIGLGAAFFISHAVESTFDVDATSASSLADFLERQGTANANTAGTTSIGDAPIWIRLLSLFFRPLYFDARDMMGYVASIENTFIILAAIYLIYHWRDVSHLARRVQFIMFICVFAFLITGVLTLMYYNVGLGLRERVMVYPMAFSLLVAIWSLRRKQRLFAQQPTLQPMISPRYASTAFAEAGDASVAN